MAKIFVDSCFEAGSDEYGSNMSGRYWFKIELADVGGRSVRNLI